MVRAILGAADARMAILKLGQILVFLSLDLFRVARAVYHHLTVGLFLHARQFATTMGHRVLRVEKRRVDHWMPVRRSGGAASLRRRYAIFGAGVHNSIIVDLIG